MTSDVALRADARLNRSRLLAAARDVFVELGPRAPLEVISRRAGIGIATLYRRFPDRRAIMRGVVLDALERTADEARRAIDEEPEPFSALVRYLRRALGTRVGAIVPILMDELALDDDAMLRARERCTRPVRDLVDNAHRAGTLRPDVTFADISMLIIRLSRPLPGSFARDLNDQLALRHLELVIIGLQVHADHAAAELPGPALTLEELRNP